MSSTNSREQIMGRLYNAQKYGTDAYLPEKKEWSIENWSRDQCIAKFTEYMSAVQTEVFRVGGDAWVDELNLLFKERGISNMLYAPATDIGKTIDKQWPADSPCQPIAWDKDVEEFKEELFAYDAAITTCLGGIAESAAVILWPTPEEPRLMSIVPPLHIVVVEADKIFTSFQEAIEKLNWSEAMPTNALLISGPSKTADIELILQFGVHGPTDFIVYIID
ncbi:LutC/YkgG family protein [Desulfotalea psychrophila]|uniref:LUD domain-containing protein n=1 Tax=Desulfotalea psychrophila (strain LSv54 / DSM 12343) TaxID=177439 RepID=Q6AIU4_DESPS|nr:lactate utilization protein [Desulfotalea psychrophila]CAG37736.1 hypothetical protein DP3007 [Desulfotalea psychrophila LSv54]